VGNIIAPCDASGTAMGDESEAAAVEFATLALNVSDIIVCGHSECGAMRALLSEEQSLPAPHLYSWLRHAEGALAKLRDGVRMKDDLDLHNHLSQLNVLEQMQHVTSYPSVRERIEAGKLDVHGWWFDIARANVMAYEKDDDRFVLIDEAEAARILARLEG
jgi:carbonic anhydrase